MLPAPRGHRAKSVIVTENLEGELSVEVAEEEAPKDEGSEC